MKLKNIFVFGIIFLLLAQGFSLDVYKAELESAGKTDTIEFINYAGPHKKIDSLASIKAIGTNLGKVIAQDLPNPNKTGNENRYAVIHAVDSSEKTKLDADIFIIGKDASVDHIKNLRHILAAYLSAAYGYSENDAETIAVFITVYNAVYRGKIDDFQKKYKKAVLDNLSEKNCGISVNYKDWPGTTQIVIPLYDVENGGLSTVDTSVISDKDVVTKMKDDDDKGIDDRKDLAKIKEREAEEAAKKAEEAAKKAAEEQKRLEEEKAKTKEAEEAAKKADEDAKKAEEDAKRAEEEAKKAKEIADANPDDEEARREAEEAAKKADEEAKKAEEARLAKEEADRKAKEQEEAEKAKQAELDKAKDDASKLQALSDKKTNEAQNDRKDIAKDQKDVLANDIANANVPSVYGIELTNETTMLSRMIKINPSNGKVIKTSPVAYIRNRTIYQAGNNFIAIAGENVKNGAVKLVILSAETMEIVSESNEIVADNSVLVQDGADYYCVIKDGKNFVIGKYNQSLELSQKSEITVKSGTPITVTSNNIVVTGADGSVKLLNKADLKVK